MNKKYVLAIDQSTQGTKCLLLDHTGAVVSKSTVAHRQLIDEKGWVSHDPEEIYRNVLISVRNVLEQSGVEKKDICCMGISNQRETTVAWDRKTGRPAGGAIVWQCARSKDICRKIAAKGAEPLIRSRTGIPLSPYFPASKMSWILEHVPEAGRLAGRGDLCFGTIDTWLVYCLTKGESYKTDDSNASRTQLLNLETLQWDDRICEVFGIDSGMLPEICDSDATFGMTDLDGILEDKIPVTGVLGDSHAALFGQGCLHRGMTKATYGTGSSVMMNIGGEPILSRNGLATSLAWKYKGKPQYVMEGNINYSGAVINWIRDIGVIENAAQTETLARAANPKDTTYLVPAFSGLGAPYWVSDARAVLCGLSRTTGREELVRAALESIAYQISDIVSSMQADTDISVPELRVDGGATVNAFLMQFQSDMLEKKVLVPNESELSGIGAGYLAGLSAGLYDESVFAILDRTAFEPNMPAAVRDGKRSGWQEAVRLATQNRYHS